MHSARIAELLEPYLGPPDARRLTPDALRNISTYIDILQRWNSRINLTAIRNEEEIVTRHFGESFFAARYLFPHSHAAAMYPPAEERRKNAAHGAIRGSIPSLEQAPEARKTTIADIGSGAGFPGIPIKLWEPEISLTLIESNHKKATFLKEVTRAITLTDINIQTARAETLPPAAYDLVTLRAVERFEAILPTAASLVAPGGRLALLIGTAQLSIAQSTLPKAFWSNPLPLPASQSRVLLVSAL